MWNVLCSILKLGKPYKYDVMKSTNCLPVTICSKIQAAFINLVLTAVKSTAFPLARSRMPAFISCRTTRAIIFFTRPRSTTKPGVFSSVAPWRIHCQTYKKSTSIHTHVIRMYNVRIAFHYVAFSRHYCDMRHVLIFYHTGACYIPLNKADRQPWNATYLWPWNLRSCWIFDSTFMKEMSSTWNITVHFAATKYSSTSKWQTCTQASN